MFTKKHVQRSLLLFSMVVIGSCIAGIAVLHGQNLWEHEALVATPNASSGSCGVERWSVKTGTDADSGLVNLNSTTPTTIASLTGLAAPSSLPSNNRIQPTETTQFVLSATLTEYKLENDSDYHLVLADGSGNTMIAEIPDPACVGSGSPFTSGIQTARQEFDNQYSVTTSFQTTSIPVCVTGVGFFDYNHGQTGVAPNAIELHPVLNIQFNPASCGGSSGGGGGVTVPTASNGSVTTSENTPVSGTLSASASAGAALTFSIVSQPASGTVSITNASTGAFTYTPANGYSGSDSFTFNASDSAGTSNTATESVTVNPVSSGGTFNSTDTPVAINDNATITDNIAVSGLSGNAPATLQVSVNITHNWSGDLEIDLIAPDGTTYVLQSPDYNNDGNINTTYTVNASSDPANGTWTLQVIDNDPYYLGDSGTLNSWSMTF